MAEGEERDERRYPQNLQGILKFCVDNTKSEDATGESQFSEMTAERRQWLQEALASMGGGKDLVKQMMEDMQLLLKPDSEIDVESKEQALDDLCELVEDLDLANDFFKIGGFTLFPPLLKHPEPSIRAVTAELMATLAQNNPFCQDSLHGSKALDVLIPIVEDSEENDNVRIKAHLAISSLVRAHEASQKDFLAADGCSVLLRAMQSGVEKLQIKATFLLCGLCDEQSSVKDILHDMGMVHQVVAMLRLPHSTFHEHLMRALLAMASDHPNNIKECQKSELQLESLLNQRLQLLKGKEEYLEETESCQQLLKLCFNDTQKTCHSVDR
ncbi:hypothetical protein CAPTEDRAFT_21393 [Capitella teleta]|uniref:Nucleotide exchange factor Fes1 domain-containing protein n=1 Tax=Capitella teleta TaxID=283909 RepID=R7T8W8_CAPTE|nr:hypothetical protein CAPTEDRAFT_21393 [Capitella teleta]|eukprot:ELT89868.1 hypothetical protein CAPTEDRAFT_21393 [Capitella teleta]